MMNNSISQHFNERNRSIDPPPRHSLMNSHGKTTDFQKVLLCLWIAAERPRQSAAGLHP